MAPCCEGFEKVVTENIDIKGSIAPGFEKVTDAFVANFAGGGELGARFCAIRDGETLVDIWAGFADRGKSVPWSDETLCTLFSSGKAAMATLVAETVSDGALDYERPIARDWPEFAAEGKGDITLAMALSHQAGLCGFPHEMAPSDWIDHDVIAARLAAMAPLWPPGTASGYHPQTIGYIVNELMRRASGRSIGAALRAKGYDIHCGLAPAEIERVAEMTKPSSAPVHRHESEMTKIAFLTPWAAAGKVSREAWLAAEIPASNMHATAKALAQIVHPLANGGVDTTGARVISEKALAAALASRIKGEDLVLPFNLDWTAGLMRNANGHFGPSASAFGHAGFGGSAVMIDPAKKLSAAYVMNKMSPSLAGDARAVALFEALDASL